MNCQSRHLISGLSASVGVPSASPAAFHVRLAPTGRHVPHIPAPPNGNNHHWCRRLVRLTNRSDGQRQRLPDEHTDRDGAHRRTDGHRRGSQTDRRTETALTHGQTDIDGGHRRTDGQRRHQNRGGCVGLGAPRHLFSLCVFVPGKPDQTPSVHIEGIRRYYTCCTERDKQRGLLYYRWDQTCIQ